MKVLPFFYNKTKTYYNRLIVEPTELPEQKTEDGLIIPSRQLPDSQIGRVFRAREDSDFKPGDEVQYMKKDRASGENIDTISIEGKVYDVIYEQKIWAVNDKPYNQIFVRPISESVVSEGGLIIPSDNQSVTKKGIVYDAPEYFSIKKGDRVEYQNTIQGYFPQCTIEGQQHDVIFESDIFRINDVVAPYRIIVKIDIPAQSIKRSSTQSGLRLSPLFIAMLRNLQYGKITGIGEKAKLLYPELSVGDTAIFDHAVESQDYRIVKQDFGKEKNVIYEHRIINCYDFSDQEIFGKLHYDKKTKKIIDITPLGGAVFMKWNFDLFDGAGKQADSALLETTDTLAQYHNLDDLKNVVGHKRREAAEKAKLKMSGIKQALAYINQVFEAERFSLLEAEAKVIAAEETRISAYLRKNHLVVCESIFPRQKPLYIISPYEELYPINLLGQKYLLGNKDFLLFQSNKNMNIKSSDMSAYSDNVLVLPFEEKSGTLLKIPDSAREKPQYGTVVKIGVNPDKIQPGDFVLFRQGAGLVQEIDGVSHRIMKQNDLLMGGPSKDIN